MAFKNLKQLIITLSIGIVFFMFILFSIFAFFDKNGSSIPEDVYTRGIFIIAVVSGIAGIVAANFISVSEIGNGLALGGLLSIIYGTVVFWSTTSLPTRVVILGAVLIILIFIAYILFGAKGGRIRKTMLKLPIVKRMVNAELKVHGGALGVTAYAVTTILLLPFSNFKGHPPGNFAVIPSFPGFFVTEYLQYFWYGAFLRN